MNIDESQISVEKTKLNAFKILMQSANISIYLPNLKHKLNQKNKLFHDIIERPKKQGARFLSTD